MNLFLLIVFILFIFTLQTNLTYSSDIQVWQGQYYSGTQHNQGTYEFNFTVYDQLIGGNQCFNATETISTNVLGYWRTEQNINSCDNSSMDYFLNINIDSSDQPPRRRLTLFNYLRKDTNDIMYGDLHMNGIITHDSPVELSEGISFVSEGIVQESIYRAKIGELYSTVPDVFDGSLIFETNVKNDFNMEMCFWDNDKNTMMWCFNEGRPFGATTLRRSLQIVGNTSSKENDENYTLCEDANYIDCNTDLTGADLYISDDIEAHSIFANEYFIGDLNGEWNGSIEYYNISQTDTFIDDVNITGKNITIGDTIIFSLGEMIDNMVDSWVQITGNLRVTGNLSVGESLTFDSVLYKGECSVNNHGIIVYELNGTQTGIHYACRQKKDAVGYEWKTIY